MNTQADSATALRKSLDAGAGAPRIERGVIQPQPYVPLSQAATLPTPPKAPQPGKPWMARRTGETPQAHVSRLFHTCYFCGHHEPDMRKLDRHEWDCDRPKEGGN
jgi:hypothetical protein